MEKPCDLLLSIPIARYSHQLIQQSPLSVHHRKSRSDAQCTPRSQLRQDIRYGVQGGNVTCHNVQ